MKKTKNAARQDSSGLATVERWAVERLDRDADMVRIEAVPMRPDKITRTLLGSLAKRGPQESMDNLSLWDVRKAKLKGMKLQTLVRKLGLRKEEEEKLSENMVFWVIRDEKAKNEQVYHATPVARKASKDLYHKVTRTGADEK
jgi:hypothetical protein